MPPGHMRTASTGRCTSTRSIAWMKAAGAVYRNTLAWSLRERLGIRMEQYGKDGEFTRIAGIPENLAGHWSKRRAAIIEAA